MKVTLRFERDFDRPDLRLSEKVRAPELIYTCRSVRQRGDELRLTFINGENAFHSVDDLQSIEFDDIENAAPPPFVPPASEISRLENVRTVFTLNFGASPTAQRIITEIDHIIESLKRRAPLPKAPSMDPLLPERMWVAAIGDIHAHNGRIIEDLVFNSYVDASKFAESRLHYYGNSFEQNIDLTDRIEKVEVAWTMEAAGVSVWVQRLDLKS